MRSLHRANGRKAGLQCEGEACGGSAGKRGYTSTNRPSEPIGLEKELDFNTDLYQFDSKLHRFDAEFI
jgi:hypothetical protein